jgi:hypothetical protein
MDIVSLISIKNTKLYDGKDGNILSLEDVMKRIEKDALLYILDYDGIELNNPNLELYQRLAEHCVLWIDNGPRRIDDVMDTIMSGATNLTLRETLWPSLDMPGVQELTDDEIFFDKTQQIKEKNASQQIYSTDIGVIVFDEALLYGSIAKEKTGFYKIYVYAKSLEKLTLWTEQGITGVIIDLNKKQGAV